MKRSWVRSGFKVILINALVFIATVLLLEGLASTVLVLKRLWKTAPLAERLHTRYDSELGWSNIPNAAVKDIFGPGVDVVINSQGFRNDRDFSPVQPPGKVRVMCVGDSYTFGYGVSQEQGWCRKLHSLETRLEPVNMGQGGYGIDQAYLWYRRDGGKLEHRLTLLAVVSVDLERMMADEFLGYAKPKLVVEDGRLLVTNVPVPRQAYLLPWTTTLYQGHFQELRTVALFHSWFPPREQQPSIIDPAARNAILEKLMEDLAKIARERGSGLAVVYLPSAPDYRPDAATDGKRMALAQAAAQHAVPYIDLVPEFRQVPASSVRDLFINKSTTTYPGAEGHYNVSGNWYIAQVLYRKLLGTPQLASILPQ